MSTLQKLRGICSRYNQLPFGTTQENREAYQEFIQAASEHFEALVELAAAVAGACSFWKDCGYLDVKKDSDGFIAPEAAIAQELCKALAKLDGRDDGP